MADWRDIIAASKQPAPIASRQRQSHARYRYTCARCATAFIAKRRGTRFCSNACSEAVRLAALRMARETQRLADAEAARLATTKGYYELRRERLLTIRRQRRDYVAAHEGATA